MSMPRSRPGHTSVVPPGHPAQHHKHAPTLVDVARRAGVSKAAVSAVMSQSMSTVRVSDSTRTRIMEAVRELKYQPNVLAQGLNGVRLKSLGVAFPSTRPNHIMTGYYSLAILRGILDASYEAGYNVTIFHQPWDIAGDEPGGFRTQGLDGFLIVAPVADSDIVAALSDLAIPLVVISTAADMHNAPSVGVDNATGVRLILDHLIRLGHQRIAHVTLDGDFHSFDSVIRRQTFLRALRGAGLPCEPEYMQAIMASYAEEAGRAVDALLKLPEPPTAIFTTNDTLARHIIAALIDRGIDVPGRISVAGFDDNPDAAAADLPLTTVRQPLTEMGAEATSRLISMLDGHEPDMQTLWFTPELIVGRSTAPPPE
jgi:LacI family transcriptional regulator